jgi:hypothetical protein
VTIFFFWYVRDSVEFFPLVGQLKNSLANVFGLEEDEEEETVLFTVAL